MCEQEKGTRSATADLFANLSHPFQPWATITLMNPLASFAFLIATVKDLASAVNARDNVYLRPALARKAVAVRLASGLRVLRAFLRRLIILIALDMEWTLVDTRGEMKRPHGRKSLSSSASFSLKGLETDKASPWLNNEPTLRKPETGATQAFNSPVQVDMTKLYAQLDFLSKIAANPAAKAKRLAFHLARNYQGIIIAPQGPKRMAGRWGTQVSASFDAMAAAIMTQSRTRPPPLAPPRTHWPTITAL
jgi:hypothetical protein